MNLFITNTQLFISQDVNWRTGVVWIFCGVLWCFYQLFGLSFWRHPFTAEDPLVSKWHNTKFLQNCWDEETNLCAYSHDTAVVKISQGYLLKLLLCQLFEGKYSQHPALCSYVSWYCFTNWWTASDVLVRERSEWMWIDSLFCKAVWPVHWKERSKSKEWLIHK